MEKFPNADESRQEKPLVPFEQSLELAKKLIEQYTQELSDIQIPDNMPEEDRRAVAWGKSAIRHFFNKIPKETLERFEGHGIFRRDYEGNLGAFINILQNRSVKGDSAKLENSGYYNANTSADFFIVSHADKPLPVYVEKSDRTQVARNKIGGLADVGAFVVNTLYYPIVDELKTMFPEANIIRANEIPEYVAKEISPESFGQASP